MQSDLQESYYIYIYKYLIRNLRYIVDLHYIMKEQDVALVIKLDIRYVYTVSLIVIVEKNGITHEGVVFI